MPFIRPLFLLVASVALSGCAGFLSWAEKPASQKEAVVKPAVVAAPAPRPAPAPPPAAERRRPIQSTGYAVISIQPHSLPAQQRLLAIRAARLDAYRGLAEQVYGQFLDGATTVADAVLRSDRVRARVEGIIHGAEVVSIMPVGQDTYELTLSLERDVVRELRALFLEETRAQVR
ncbi:MAG: hypothetical protein RL322_2408 [Pseudomonadota bacterium]|jgi:hypothetical protein